MLNLLSCLWGIHDQYICESDWIVCDFFKIRIVLQTKICWLVWCEIQYSAKFRLQLKPFLWLVCMSSFWIYKYRDLDKTFTDRSTVVLVCFSEYRWSAFRPREVVAWIPNIKSSLVFPLLLSFPVNLYRVRTVMMEYTGWRGTKINFWKHVFLPFPKLAFPIYHACPSLLLQASQMETGVIRF